MPIYEYECKECGVRFDRLQAFGEPAPDRCPNGHPQVHRVFSEPTIIFHGSGFYVTDHGRNGGKRSGRARKSEEPKQVSSTEKAGPAST